MLQTSISSSEKFEFDLKLALERVLSYLKCENFNSLVTKNIHDYLSKPVWSAEDRNHILHLASQWLLISELTVTIACSFFPLLPELFFIAIENICSLGLPNTYSDLSLSIKLLSAFSKTAAQSFTVKKSALNYYSEHNVFHSITKLLFSQTCIPNVLLDGCEYIDKVFESNLEVVRSCWRLIKCDMGCVANLSYLFEIIHVCQKCLKSLEESTEHIQTLTNRKLLIEKNYVVSLKCVSSLLCMEDWEVSNFDFNFKTNFEYMSFVDEDDSSQFNSIAAVFSDCHSVSCNESSMKDGFVVTTDDFQSNMKFVARVLLDARKEKSMLVEQTHLPSLNQKYSFNTNENFIVTSSSFGKLQTFSLAVARNNPVLLIGPTGSGKTSLVHYFAHLLGHKVNTIYVACALDAKMLLGGYVMTDTPGVFKWNEGLLTRSVREGNWVIIKDYDMASPDVTGILGPLIKSRQLFIPSRAETINASSEFCIFATVTISSVKNIDNIQNFDNFNKVYVERLSDVELSEIIQKRFNFGKKLSGLLVEFYSKVSFTNDRNFNERKLNIKDLFKWVVRIHESIYSYSPSEYDYMIDLLKSDKSINSGIKELVVTEAQDIYCSSLQNIEILSHRLNALSEVFSLSSDRVNHLFYTSVPELKIDKNFIRIGRVVFENRHDSKEPMFSKSVFIHNTLSLKLLEKVAQSITLNESVLLVGETGCGKTTIVQYLADLMKKKLHVINFSQSSDPTDFIGGFRPVDLEWISRPCYRVFEYLFVKTFSVSKNQALLKKISNAFLSKNYSLLVKIWNSVVEAAGSKLKQENVVSDGAFEAVEVSSKIIFNGEEENNSVLFIETLKLLTLEQGWLVFKDKILKFSIQIKGAKAFQYVDGELLKAMHYGNWILLDEINLALPDVLEYLSGILSGEVLTFTERGDAEPITRHPDFRVLAAMNPSTDFGKSQLADSLRVRFTEYYVNDIENKQDLIKIVDGHLKQSFSKHLIVELVDLYFNCKNLISTSLLNVSNQRPIFNLRTISRVLEYATDTKKIYGAERALYEGLKMAFLTQLNSESLILMDTLLIQFKNKCLPNLTSGMLLSPPNKTYFKGDLSFNPTGFVNFEQFSIEKGPLTPFLDSSFIITPTVKKHLVQICRSLITRKYPILLQGSTSTGKTSMIEYLAKLTGNHFVRVNNSDQTDVQEYIGQYTYDVDQKIVFQEGIFVNALRKGYWILLDELNLAPSEILEALNRLLDDNRQLYVPELQEFVKPHPNFCLFATQNPPGLYGGRKYLSKAFRSRFLEIHLEELPHEELETILVQKFFLPSSFSQKIILIMKELQRQRQSSQVFAGKNLITLRDLFKLAQRNIRTYYELGVNAYFLFAEKLRDEDEKINIKLILEKTLKIELDIQKIYQDHWENSLLGLKSELNTSKSSQIIWTNSSKRLFTLIHNCLKNKEPVLLIGPPGTGKTAMFQFYSKCFFQKLQIINCHQGTDTSDFIGSIRPVRGKEKIVENLIKSSKKVFYYWKEATVLGSLPNIDYHDSCNYKVVFDYINELNSKVEEIIRTQNCDYIDRVAVFYLQKSIQAYMEIYKCYNASFSWYDGPLISSMKHGDILLIDEISLAECSVLERLNSLLETGRSVVLSEKNSLETEHVYAHPEFRVVATMNPSGDFGKKELSPALRNRFTEIYVPPITSKKDLIQIISLKFENFKFSFLAVMMVDFVFYLEEKMRGVWLFTLRDIINWTEFINSTWSKIGLISSYLHGSSMVILDGLPMIQFSNVVDLKLDLVLKLKSQVKFITDSLAEHQNVKHTSSISGKNIFIKWNKLGLDSEVLELVSCSDLIEYPYNPLEMCSLQLFETSSIDPELLTVSENTLSIGTFSINISRNLQASQLSTNLILPKYCLKSPTIIKNTLRLLRALQLNKPVLLEGSPGVGKTSIVEALAYSCNHKIVRINLSDQTDIMDLLGADLPAECLDKNNEPHYQWRDGIFLNALKSGSWVLLDELNLANQSVLEGLNSVLDHRKEIYIPELSTSFTCPPSFQIFATQNPVSQGGGRKGLPKSFLNRFSKVYLDSMTDEDMIYISSHLYTSINIEVIKKMVQFNSIVSKNVEEMKFARQGYPWEFNLRDILKWCQLVVDSQHKEAEIFVDLLYLQRLRTADDRSELRKIFEQVFGKHLPCKDSSFFSISPNHVQLGEILISRKWSVYNKCQISQNNTLVHSKKPLLLNHLMDPLKSLIYCINKKWLSILVGPTASGKSSTLNLLSKLTGNCLLTFSMNSSVDTMELIGGFEQVDINRQSKFFLNSLDEFIMDTAKIVLYIHQNVSRNLSEEYSTNNESFTSKVRTTKIVKSLKNDTIGNLTQLLLEEMTVLLSAWDCFSKDIVKTENYFPIFSNEEKFNSASKILSMLSSLHDKLHKFNYENFVGINENTITNLEQMMLKIKDLIGSKSNGCFEWTDSLLVQALKNGNWIVIDNVNLCPGPVLDRILQLFEPNGKLSIPEKGLTNGQISEIYPHKNFRIFFTMDPKYGELSRAMRNRGLEISFLPYSIAENEDTKCLLQKILRFNCDELTIKMIQFHTKFEDLKQSFATKNFSNEENIFFNNFVQSSVSIKELLNWASMFVDQIERGCDKYSSLVFSMKQIYIRNQSSKSFSHSVNLLFESVFQSQSAELAQCMDSRNKHYINLFPGFSNFNDSVNTVIDSKNLHLSYYSKPYVSLIHHKTFESIQKLENYSSIQAIICLLSNCTEELISKSFTQLKDYLEASLKPHFKDIYDGEKIVLDWFKEVYDFSHENEYSKHTKNLYRHLSNLRFKAIEDSCSMECCREQSKIMFQLTESCYPISITHNNPLFSLLYKISLSDDKTWFLFQKVYQSSRVLELHLETFPYKWINYLITEKKMFSATLPWLELNTQFPCTQTNSVEILICQFFKCFELIIKELIANMDLHVLKNELFSLNDRFVDVDNLKYMNLDIIIKMTYQLLLDTVMSEFKIAEFFYKWRCLVKYIIKYMYQHHESFVYLYEKYSSISEGNVSPITCSNGTYNMDDIMFSLVIIVRKLQFIFNKQFSSTFKSALSSKSLNVLPFKSIVLFDLYEKFSNLPPSITLYSSNTKHLKSITNAMATLLYVNFNSQKELYELNSNRNSNSELVDLLQSLNSLYNDTLKDLRSFESEIIEQKRLKLIQYSEESEKLKEYKSNCSLASSEILINEMKTIKSGSVSAFFNYEVLLLEKHILKELRNLIVSVDVFHKTDLKLDLLRISNLIVHLLNICCENICINMKHLSTLQLILWTLNSSKLNSEATWTWFKQIVLQYEHELLLHIYYNNHLSNWTVYSTKQLVVSSPILDYFNTKSNNLQIVKSKITKISAAHSELNWLRIESSWKSLYLFNFLNTSSSCSLIEASLKIDQLELILNYMKPKTIQNNNEASNVSEKNYLYGFEVIKSDWQILLNNILSLLIVVSKDSEPIWVELINNLADRLFERKSSCFMNKNEFFKHYSLASSSNDQKLINLNSKCSLLFEKFLNSIYRLYIYEDNEEHNLEEFLNSIPLNLIRGEMIVWMNKIKIDLVFPNESMDSSFKHTCNINLLNSMKDRVNTQISVLQSQIINKPNHRIEYLLELAVKIERLIESETSKKIDRPKLSPSFSEVYNQLKLSVQQHCEFRRLNDIVSSLHNIKGNQNTNLSLVLLSEIQIQKNLKLCTTNLEKISVYYPDVVGLIVSCMYEIMRGIRLIRTNIERSLNINNLIISQENNKLQNTIQIEGLDASSTYNECLNRIQKLIEYVLDPSIVLKIDNYIPFILSKNIIDAVRQYYLMKNYLLSLTKKSPNDLASEIGNLIDKCLHSNEMNSLILNTQFSILQTSIGYLYYQMSLTSHLSLNNLNSINTIFQIFVNTNSLEEKLNLENQQLRNSMFTYKSRENCTKNESDFKNSKLKSLFPNYFEEFELFLNQENTDECQINCENLVSDQNSRQTKEAELGSVTLGVDKKLYKFSKKEVYLLSELHYKIFSSYCTCIRLGVPIKTLSEHEKTNLKYGTYGLTRLLIKMLGEDMSNSGLDSKLSNLHVFAVSETKKFLTSSIDLNTVKQKKRKSEKKGTVCEARTHHKSQLAHSQVYDFYKAANPGEVYLLLEPLKLLQRDLEFYLSLETIGENCVLINLLKITLKLLNKQVSEPLMSFVIGCEVLIERAQEWVVCQPEMYSINSSLERIHKLVSKWRLMELKHWPNLLDIKDEKFQIKASYWWFHLHCIMNDLKKNLILTNSTSSEKRELTEQFVNSIQAFLENSPCGEFKTRLKLILAFHYQMKTEFLMKSHSSDAKFTAGVSYDSSLPKNTTACFTLMISNIIYNIYAYYAQFVEFFDKEVTSRKNLIKSKLDEYISICKWDDSSYYILKKNTETSNRKLMTFMEDYSNNVLTLNFHDVIKNVMSKKIDFEISDNNCTIVFNDIVSHTLFLPAYSKEFDTTLFNNDFINHTINSFNTNIKTLVLEDTGSIDSQSNSLVSNNIHLNILSLSKRIITLSHILENHFDNNKNLFNHVEQLIKDIKEQPFLKSKLKFSLIFSQFKNMGLDFRKIFIKSLHKRLPPNLIFNETSQWKDNYYCMLEQPGSISDTILKLQNYLDKKRDSNEKSELVNVYSEVFEFLRKQDEHFYRSVFLLNHLWSLEKISEIISTNELKKLYGVCENILQLSILQKYTIKNCFEKQFEVHKVINLLDSLIGNEKYVTMFNHGPYEKLDISDEEIMFRDVSRDELIDQKEELINFLMHLENLKITMMSYCNDDSLVLISEIIDSVNTSKDIIETNLFEKSLSFNEKVTCLVSFVSHEILTSSKELVENSIEKLKSFVPAFYLCDIICYQSNLHANQKFKSLEKMMLDFNSDNELEKMLSNFLLSFKCSIRQLLVSIQNSYKLMQNNEHLAQHSAEDFNWYLTIESLCDLADCLDCNKFVPHLFDSINELHKYVSCNYSNDPSCKNAIYFTQILMKEFATMLKLWSSWNLYVIYELSQSSHLSIKLNYVVLNSAINSVNEADLQNGDKDVDENEDNDAEDGDSTCGMGFSGNKGDKDVTGEYSDQEQLMEDHGDSGNEKDDERDEAQSENSIEMENDFKGEIENSKENQDNESSEENTTEDREIGDIDDLEEEALDEKIWDQNEDTDEQLDREQSNKYKNNQRSKSKNQEMTAKTEGENSELKEEDHNDQQDKQDEDDGGDEVESSVSMDQNDEEYKDDYADYENQEFVDNGSENFNFSDGSGNDNEEMDNIENISVSSEESSLHSNSSGNNDEQDDYNFEDDNTSINQDEARGDEQDNSFETDNQSLNYQSDNTNKNILENEQIQQENFNENVNGKPNDRCSMQNACGVQENAANSNFNNSHQSLNTNQNDFASNKLNEQSMDLEELEEQSNSQKSKEEKSEHCDSNENLHEKSQQGSAQKQRPNSSESKLDDKNSTQKSNDFKENNPFNRSLGDINDYWNKKKLNIQNNDSEKVESITGGEDDESDKMETNEKSYEFLKDGDDGEFDNQIMDFALEEQLNDQNCNMLLEDEERFADETDKDINKGSSYSMNENELLDNNVISSESTQVGENVISKADKESDVKEVEVRNETFDRLIGPDEIVKLRCEMQDIISSTKNKIDDIRMGREIWSRLQAITFRSSQVLCEQLRLILEPTMKNRMQGDYKTGKRLNMRRIVTYVASQYKKNLIWLRRSKPSNREYQIILALDDSKSIKLGKADCMMREAMATISIALHKLQVGQFGLMKFGEETTLLHPVEMPFSDEAASMIQYNLSFEQNLTNMDNLLSTSINLLKHSKSRVSENLKVSQILFVIGDGRFGDQRSRIKYWLQQAQINNIFIVYIILDFLGQKESILDIQTVKTLNAKEILICPYIDEFPFFYYVIIRDINSLTDTLCNALKQWFEIVTK